MRFFLKSKKIKAARHAKTPIPPAAPPAIAPIGTVLSFVSTVIGGVGIAGAGTGDEDVDIVLVTVELDGNGGGLRESSKVAVYVYRSELQPKFVYVLFETTKTISPQNLAVAAVQ